MTPITAVEMRALIMHHAQTITTRIVHNQHTQDEDDQAVARAIVEHAERITKLAQDLYAAAE